MLGENRFIDAKTSGTFYPEVTKMNTTVGSKMFGGDERSVFGLNKRHSIKLSNDNDLGTVTT